METLEWLDIDGNNFEMEETTEESVRKPEYILLNSLLSFKH